MSGFESAGFDHFAIFLFASRPGRNLVSRRSGSAIVGIARAISKPGSAKRQLQAGISAGTVTSNGGRYGSPLNSTAHAIRASLLARATATTLV